VTGRAFGSAFFVYNIYMEEKNAADLHEERVAALPTRLRGYWEDAQLQEMQPSYEGPSFTKDEWGVLEVAQAPLCPGFEQKYTSLPATLCTRPAGYLTHHEGVGMCFYHGGYFGRELKKGAILMALAYADEMNMSPWDALLSQCRLLANQVAWLRLRVYEAEKAYGAAGLRPGGEGFDWVMMLEARGDRLAKVAKMCLDAGIQERVVQQIEVESKIMVEGALAGLDALELEGDARDRFLDAMSSRMLELTSGTGES
jgi:hypothetical protein